MAYNNIKQLNEKVFVFPEDAKITETTISWQGKEYRNIPSFKKAFEDANNEYKFNVQTGKYFPIGVKHISGNLRYLETFHNEIYKDLLGTSSRITNLYIYRDVISTTRRTCVTGMEDITFASVDEQNKFIGFRKKFIPRENAGIDHVVKKSSDDLEGMKKSENTKKTKADDQEDESLLGQGSNKKSGKSDSAEDLTAELKKKKDSDVKSNEKSISKKEAEKGSLEDGDKNKKKSTKKEPKEPKDPKENSGNKNFL
jgi:hypothetical protein